MTTIGRLSEKVFEAGWLVALVLIATFLNPFSDQVFEPDKAALLRMLVTLMAAVWVIRSLDGGALPASGTADRPAAGHRLHRASVAVRDNPIAGLALLLLLVDLAATATSVSPRVSWWGSYQRAQGTHTLLAYLGLFCAVLVGLRRTDQLQRLVTVLLFTSFPVALYAVLQRYGMSLLQFSESGVASRVISTLGNAIFLAAYLATVVPLTLWRLLDSMREWSKRPARTTVAIVIYGGLALLQLAAIVFTQSRGPILGLLVELFVFALLVALVRGQRRWALGGLLAAALAGGLLLALNVPGLPTDGLRRLAYVARFGELAGQGAESVAARALAWDTVLHAMQAQPARLGLGYGPETMKSVLTRYMPAELWVLQGGGQYGTFDRAHNAFFDALYARGIVGALACLLVYAVVFFQGLRWMGLVPGRRAAGVLIGLLVGGAGLGLLVPWLWVGRAALAAIGIPFGMVAGLVCYVLGLAGWPGRSATDARPAPVHARGEYLLLMAALLAAMVGHVVEVQTGIAIVATRAHFWLYAALLALLGTGRIAEPHRAPFRAVQPAGRGRFRRNRRAQRRADVAAPAHPTGDLGAVIAMALVAAVLLGTLSYAFVHGFNVPGAQRPAQILIGATWLFTGSLVLLEHARSRPDSESAGGDAAVFVAVSLLWLMPFTLYHRETAQSLERLNAAYLVFLLWLLLSTLGIAVALQSRESVARLLPRADRLALYAGIMFVAALLVWRLDVNRVRADIYEKIGKTAIGAGLWDQAIPNLGRAVALQPSQDQYYIFLGGAYVEQARLAAEPAVKDAHMETALTILEQGRALAPRDSDQSRQLGLAYRVWADWAADGTTRRQRLEQSLAYYWSAVELNPQNPDLRLDLAGGYFALGMNDDAQAQYQHAVEIGSPAHLGRAHAGLGDVYLVQGRLEAALGAYQEAMRAGRGGQDVLDSRIRAAGSHPDDVQVRMSLALVYAAANRRDEALKELAAALEMAATDAQRAEVEQLLTMVGE